MKKIHALDALALTTVALLCSCGGSTGGFTGSPPVKPFPPPSNATQTIVGLGDSLTAGYQSSGMVGATTISLTAYGTLFTGVGLNTLPPTQENGWFSLFYSDAKGLSWAQQATPGFSVLPLVGAPGIGNQILPANPADTGGIPFSTVPGRSSCDSFNQAAFSYGQASSTAVRMNPTSTTYDLGIPSLTIHEAIAMYQPTATTCVPYFSSPSNTEQFDIDALQSLVSGESQSFYPVMEKYSTPSNHVTPLNAAVSLSPTLTTVWLGANDLLKYAFSGGTAGGLDITQGQVQTDMTTIIQTLKRAGSYVIVADLPNIIETPQFAIVANPPSQTYCQLQTWLPCILFDLGYSWTAAQTETTDLQITYPFLAPSGSQNAYLTETGLLTLLEGGTLTADENGTNYLTAAFATQVATVNSNINAGIRAAAASNGVPLIPVDQIFESIYNGSGTYFDEVAAINPGKCCSLAFGGGLLTFDGLHPSDTGYALIAQVFAQTANSTFGTSLGAINPSSAYSGAGGIYASYPDPYACHTTCI